MRLTAKLVLAIVIGWAVQCASQANAQTRLLGVTGTGVIVEIDKTTGAPELVGDSGFTASAAASDSLNRMFTAGGSSGDSNKVVLINTNTGAGSDFLDLVGKPGGFGIRGIAFNSSDVLYALFSQADTLAIDLLATIDMTTGDVSLVGTDGETGLPNIQGLAFDNADNLFRRDRWRRFGKYQRHHSGRHDHRWHQHHPRWATPWNSMRTARYTQQTRISRPSTRWAMRHWLARLVRLVRSVASGDCPSPRAGERLCSCGGRTVVDLNTTSAKVALVATSEQGLPRQWPRAGCSALSRSERLHRLLQG